MRDLWRQYGTLVRSWALFALLLGLHHTAQVFVDARYWAYLDRWTATLTAWSLNLVGDPAQAQGDLVTSTLYPIRIIRECTAVYPIGIFVAAVLAYPCRLKAKLPGLLVGVPVLVLLNQVRLVSLCFVGRFYPARFDQAHLLVWQSLIIFGTLLLWIVWILLLASRHEAKAS